MKQRMSVAVLAGLSAERAIELHATWEVSPDTTSIDAFCSAIRQHGDSPPVIYYAEWIDTWLMGDEVPGPRAIQGKHFQCSVMNTDVALNWAGQLQTQWNEQVWFATRLREAVSFWEEPDFERAIVVIRQVVAGSTDDKEVVASLRVVPGWLAQFTAPVNPR